MHEQRAGVGAEQEVLGAPLETPDALGRERSWKATRDGPAQARLADFDASDGAADHVRGEAAARGLDFGQLRHGASLKRQGRRPKILSLRDARHAQGLERWSSFGLWDILQGDITAQLFPVRPPLTRISNP